ncbi:hypothetical protein A7311_01050 [Paenibacillus polymyxa]|uniref:DUF4373 domain-containing protein n=1 Tax=Paenibacillus polymyxa TaxID=1406 RepID=UPI00083D49C6|nr:DUF4373 domain-containing protein [Paenibacillus polymyxa]ODB56943.1 hypothetical protein A7311_01050 [Paenibacillus polymyxa]
MARPRKEGMDYFPHDTDAVNDTKIEALRMLYGNDGYAFYFILLELIYKQPNFELDVSDAETMQILAKKVEVTQEEFGKMLATAIKRECFDPVAYQERQVLTSEGIKKRSKVVVEKRERMRKKPDSTAVSELLQGYGQVSAAETTAESAQSKVKGKESKRKVKGIEYTPEFNEFWNVYPRKVGKLECFKTWKKVTKNGESHEFITMCAKNYAADCKAKQTADQFIKHPKSFLNDERYKDYAVIVIGGGNGGKSGRYDARHAEASRKDASKHEELFIGKFGDNTIENPEEFDRMLRNFE